MTEPKPNPDYLASSLSTTQNGIRSLTSSKTDAKPGPVTSALHSCCSPSLRGPPSSQGRRPSVIWLLVPPKFKSLYGPVNPAHSTPVSCPALPPCHPGFSESHRGWAQGTGEELPFLFLLGLLHFRKQVYHPEATWPLHPEVKTTDLKKIPCRVA